jgi:hypothetical protein
MTCNKLMERDTQEMIHHATVTLEESEDLEASALNQRNRGS